MADYLGDVVAGATVRGVFNTRDASGAPVTLDSGAIRVYKDDGTTEDDSGITLNTDFDSKTGLHLWEIDTSADGTFYSAGSDFFVFLSAGTADSVSVVGVSVGHFSIENRNDKADVREFGGSAGTFASGRPEVNTTHAAGTAWGSGAITAAAIATGAIDADAIADNAIDAGAIADNAITAAKIAAGAIDAATFAADVDAEILSYLVDDATRIDASALNTASGAIGSDGSGLTEAGGTGDHLTAINLPNQTMDIVGNITGNLSGSVGSVTGSVGSVTGNVGGNVTGSIGSLATQAKADVNAEVDTALSDYDAPTKAELDSAVAPLALETTAQSIKDKTDNLPSDPADQSAVEAAIDAAESAILSAIGDVPTNSELTSALETALTTAVADSVPSDGNRPSIAQAAYITTQFLLERAVTGTTMTVRKPDGSTALLTLTLDDATAPTSVTRTS